MTRLRIGRRLFGLLATLMLVTVAALVQASPAAAVDRSFGNSDGTVWGTVPFKNGHSVVVKGSIYGLSNQHVAIYYYYNGASWYTQYVDNPYV